MEDADRIIDDIFEQEEKKNRKDLRAIPQYKETEYIGEDDFDINYRTHDKTIEDLFPKKFKTVKIGDPVYEDMDKTNRSELAEYLRSQKYGIGPHIVDATYNKMNKEIQLIDKKEFLKYRGNEQQYFNAGVHENIHKHLDTAVGVMRKNPAVRKTRFSDSEYKFAQEVAGDINYADVLDDLATNLNINRYPEDFSYKPKYKKALAQVFPKHSDRGYNINEITHPTEEMVASHFGAHPEYLLNPKTKTTKAMARLIWA